MIRHGKCGCNWQTQLQRPSAGRWDSRHPDGVGGSQNKAAGGGLRHALDLLTAGTAQALLAGAT
jgi:hypothetical protein